MTDEELQKDIRELCITVYTAMIDGEIETFNERFGWITLVVNEEFFLDAKYRMKLED